MTIGLIANREQMGSIRGKLNEAITAVNTMVAPVIDDAATAAANSAALTAYILANISDNGVATVLFDPGTYKMAFAPNVPALKAAGIRHMVLDARIPGTVEWANAVTEEAFLWDNHLGASAPIAVTAISNQIHNTYDWITRLSIANSGWQKWDKITITSQDRPLWSAGSRYMGESFRVIDADAQYVWVDGQLEWASEYLTSPVARRLDDAIKFTVRGIKFVADGDSTDVSVTTRTKAVARLASAVGCKFIGCTLEAPWYTGIRMEGCVDCDCDDMDFEKGENVPSIGQLTYGLVVYGACYNCWLTNSRSIGYRHTFTTDGNGATTFTAGNFYLYGQPTTCGCRSVHGDSSRGSPFDTHEEGSNILFYDCTISNGHTSDQDPAAFVGCGYQVRCRRVTIDGADVRHSNGGVNWKPHENGVDDWLRITNTKIREGTYQSDSTRGVYITSGGTITTVPRLRMEDVLFDLMGISVESDIPVEIDGWGVKSKRPHRGHFDLATGSIMRLVDTVWDSRSANLPGASTANRTLFGVICAGVVQVHLIGLTHTLGSDTAKHTPHLFEGSGAHVISLTDYREIDPSAIGRRQVIKTGQDANFTIAQSDDSYPIAAADKFAYWTAARTMAHAGITAAGRALIGPSSFLGVGFSAHKNTTSQTGVADITYTAVTWGTEVYDTGSYFAASAWTPPAGLVHLDATLYVTGTFPPGAALAVAIAKNGTAYKQALTFSMVANAAGLHIAVDDRANGTDVYTVQVYMDLTSGTGTVDGALASTHFEGHWVGP